MTILNLPGAISRQHPAPGGLSLNPTGNAKC